MPEAHGKVPFDSSERPSQESLDRVRERAENDLEGKGRIVIRPSGTEPIIRVMVQHESSREAESLVQALSDEISTL